MQAKSLQMPNDSSFVQGSNGSSQNSPVKAAGQSQITPSFPAFELRHLPPLAHVVEAQNSCLPSKQTFSSGLYCFRKAWIIKWHQSKCSTKREIKRDGAHQQLVSGLVA
ncbi:unnamed protein product [Protopolystoma xenopodis]|uniref:Uncharacterized protein n=1 Tax=Protopolystoma xenopodis TaxID=117903 RepID=A0A448WQ95_9PLAT|nr:unnamed protein product [Protopolystoma xenopodis]